MDKGDIQDTVAMENRGQASTPAETGGSVGAQIEPVGSTESESPNALSSALSPGVAQGTEAGGSAAIQDPQKLLTSAPAFAEPPSAKRSPAEAFAEMAQSVRALSTEVGTIHAFVRGCTERSDALFLHGIRSLTRLHVIVFRHLFQGKQKDDPFARMILENIEAEIRGIGVEVLHPKEGDEVDLTTVSAIGTEACPFLQKPDRIASVCSLGFAIRVGSERTVFQKAEVIVYKRKA